MSEPERPAANWPRDEAWAGVAETHAAAVFLAGDLACMLKKPVSLGFLDFSTVAARTEACAREVELNREFAPDVYLGVAELRGPDGHRRDVRLRPARHLSFD
jgi:aminoglycoside phosphotransferase family enzyme